MNQLDIRFTGAVLDLTIELEGREVGLYFDGVSEWSRTIEEFEIKGELDLLMLCKGMNGTSWELEIVIDTEHTKTYRGEINKGYSLLSDEIDLSPKG
ncbi:hypothetical protein SAMN05443144_101330 [Fodinibius roseus]|uniref:Uncharacterized protein n=1 Tax=Fodinibius roseus TaxID=1194090 RepID=A0A1M4TM00_9BACT|nr:hypothetical protein [Fodinibius roseus]SHE45513.1 hypothetical protein SAMN05443144_101330 [Fodinibius roseus]